MRSLNSPITILTLVMVTGLAAAALVLWTALAHPWIGLRLVATPEGVVVRQAAPDGPAAQIAPGTVLRALAGIALEPGDIVEEPDTLATFADYDRFMDRQHALWHTLRSSQDGVVLDTDHGPLTLRPALARPISDLPPLFWAQVGVGLGGFWIGAWVWAVRRGGQAEAFLQLAGVGLMISAMAAAVYSTRELALPLGLFRVLQGFNHLGALVFGAGMIGLFLCYPVRLVGTRWLWMPAAVLLAWWAGNEARLFPDHGTGIQMPIGLAMVAILICVGVQYRATRGDPRARAALRWFGLSVLIGAGIPVMVIVLPRLIGTPAPVSQGFAFLFFLLIYIGLALGVARYRLFELEDWAFRILFTMGGVTALLGLDALLIYAVALERAPAFGLSLVVVALAYLPLRDALARRLLGSGTVVDRDNLFRKVSDVAFAPPGTSQRQRWETLLRAEFAPLRIEPLAVAPGAARLAEDGMALDLPAIDTLPALRLVWARGGRLLFSARDLGRATELCAMLGHTSASRRAYETGVSEERARIAQDMHDNIGIQLMGALHSPSPDRKDALIRETLTDLRDIISNADRENLTLEETFADLRAEISEHLSAAGIALDWMAEGHAGAALPPRLAHALRSVLREAASNILRHSGARRARVVLAVNPAGLRLEVQDDGCGIPAAPARAGGQGLSNMRARVSGLGGALDVSGPGTGGTLIRASIPLAAQAGAQAGAPT